MSKRQNSNETPRKIKKTKVSDLSFEYELDDELYHLIQQESADLNRSTDTNPLNLSFEYELDDELFKLIQEDNTNQSSIKLLIITIEFIMRTLVICVYFY